MPRRVPARPEPVVRPLRRALRRLCTTLVLACAGLLAAATLGGCGGGGCDSPEALFARIQELNAAGRTEEIWNLCTEQRRENEAQIYESYKEFLRRNPDAKNRKQCIEQYHMTPEELYPLDAKTIFVRENAGRERFLEGAQVLSVEGTPDLPNGARVRWRTALGAEYSMVAQLVDDGWYLVTLKE